MNGSSNISIQYRAFYTPKRGNQLHHYEDAFAMDGVDHIDNKQAIKPEKCSGFITPYNGIWRCAVADGASQGGYSQIWAQMLVDDFIWNVEHRLNNPILQPDLKGIREWLKNCSVEWDKHVIPTILDSVPPNSARRSRTQQSLLLEGQASTLAMLELDVNQQRWKSAVLGDTLLFHHRKGQGILPVRPYSSLMWHEMDTNPILISSQSVKQDVWIWNNSTFNHHDAFVDSDFEVGDQFLLMTDALGKWFLRLLNLNPTHLENVFSMQSNDEFIQLVENCRDRPTEDNFFMGNDDKTLLIIEVVPSQVAYDVKPARPIKARQFQPKLTPQAPQQPIKEDRVVPPMPSDFPEQQPSPHPNDTQFMPTVSNASIPDELEDENDFSTDMAFNLNNDTQDKLGQGQLIQTIPPPKQSDSQKLSIFSSHSSLPPKDELMDDPQEVIRKLRELINSNEIKSKYRQLIRQNNDVISRNKDRPIYKFLFQFEYSNLEFEKFLSYVSLSFLIEDVKKRVKKNSNIAKKDLAEYRAKLKQIPEKYIQGWKDSTKSSDSEKIIKAVNDSDIEALISVIQAKKKDSWL
jgi:hypothetical protein